MADYVEIKVTPTIATGAYALGRTVGGILTFAGAARSNGGTGTVVKVVLADLDQERANFDLLLWNTSPAGTLTDNNATDPNDSAVAPDLYKGHIPIGSGNYVNLNDNAMATVKSDLYYACAAGDTALYGVLMIGEAHTYTTSGDLSVVIGCIRDG